MRENQTIAVPPPESAAGTAAVAVVEARAPQLTPGLIRSFMQARGVHEDILVHTQDYREFLREKGVTELGRGGEGAVYFLRGHVVKLTGVDFTPALLREIVHMLHLNPISGQSAGAAMGERQRQDLPSLLWVYTLSNGGLSVGMKPFDLADQNARGSTLHDRLYDGPAMDREHALRAVLSICKTLVYTEKKGIIHHDLKPANIYIPADPRQDAVVFDLGQALWRQNSWGVNWLTHGHNLHYWYNGTYQYMHRLRRIAHLCALAISTGHQPTQLQRNSFTKYVPSLYDDVFSFAYIVRNVVRSRFTQLREIDKRLLTGYYRALMELNRVNSAPVAQKKETLMGRVTTLFAKAPPAQKAPQQAAAKRIESMEQAYLKLEPIVATLLAIK